jgi:hypothetical protein
MATKKAKTTETTEKPKRAPKKLEHRRPKKTQRMVRRSEDGDGLTRALLDAVVESMVTDKLPRKYAATVNGVSPRTLELWITMGAAGLGTSIHAELAREIYQAEGGIVGAQMQNLYTLGSGDPNASVAFLKFFKPLDFGGQAPAGDEFQEPARNAQKQDALLSNPPPRMLAKFREHGWWKFSPDVDAEDRMVLLAIQEKYARMPLEGAP